MEILMEIDVVLSSYWKIDEQFRRSGYLRSGSSL
jgi:hypothetical protein